MAYRPHALPVLIVSDPSEARQMILRAFVQANGCRARAASALGCSRSTLFQWIKKLGMGKTLEDAEKILRREGWHHVGRETSGSR